jgi:hypothetical protein
MIVFFALQAASAGAFDLRTVEKMVASRSCGSDAAEGEVVVCGTRRSDERFRVPPSEDSSQPGARHRGDAPPPVAGITSTAPCGIFQGQRACSKQEMLDAGYGGGRDPITLAGKVIGALLDPD